MFSKCQLISIVDEQLNLYMDWLLESISRCETEADKNCTEVSNEVFFRLKQRMLH